MLTTENIVRCGRCNVIVTEAELETQRYPDRVRCGGCECPGSVHDFLTFASLATPEGEGQREWLRRIGIAECDNTNFQTVTLRLRLS